MYYLMNKDTKVAIIASNDKFAYVDGVLPLGFTSFDTWLENRKAYNHNAHLKRLMTDLGCDTKDGFIQVTHAASINDTYWVQSEKENLTWQEISFYRNSFNEQISKLAFAGLGLYGQSFSTTVPELTTDGSFRKCWRRENDEIYLYKQGYDIGSNAGLEPYSEVLASELIKQVCPNAVTYELVKLRNEMTSKCKLFTKEAYGYVPLSRILPKIASLDEILGFYTSIGSEDEFRRMMVMDAITFNQDRHLGNLGVLVNNDTQEIIKMAPNFDYNLALLPYVIDSEFSDIGTKLLDYGPKIGTDFTALGQSMMTDDIRSDVEKLRDYHFTFRGDTKFSPDRVGVLEKIVQTQIDAVLSKHQLQTKDVFIPTIPDIVLTEYDNSEEIQKADAFLKSLSDTNITSKYTEEDENGHINCRISYMTNNHFFDILIAMETDDISLELDGTSVRYEDISDATFLEAYDSICEQYDDYLLDLQQNITLD